ncbi:uncharacterized protein LOC126555597 [Aphis gossypii]|uniref:uncharacterized protein LOC126555125 n=1 Tax=Aphis gossypii TaxID=80765 RepID=UPI002158E23F|nr:uncharacterized protein LOC126555125 [Aphis gossypii]XP_050066453.1 uncharacterized protein LOC126555597 [Aphis gossypii]
MNRKKVQVIVAAEALGLLDTIKSERRYWVYLLNVEREKTGHFKIFFENIRRYPQNVFEYYRISISSFDELLEILRPYITETTTLFRNPICAEERLTITLRYLSIGTYFAALKFDFQVGRSTIKVIVKETCQAIWTNLNLIEMTAPTIDEWMEISRIFYLKTNFPNCLEAINEKHIRCKNSNNSGSLFFNYEKFFSIVLMAVVDANLNFISIDVGSYGREGDSNIFKERPFGKLLYSKKLNILEPTILPNTNNSPQLYVFVRDEAFALHTNLLRPYPGCNINDSRRNQILRMKLSKLVVFYTTSSVRQIDGINYEDSENNSLDDIETHGVGAARSQSVGVRDYFANYFMGPGAVDFQYKVL